MNLSIKLYFYNCRYNIIQVYYHGILKMLFIIVWKVARLLVISKNIIKGLVKPIACVENSLSFIVRLNVDIVKLPAYIKLGDKLGD